MHITVTGAAGFLGSYLLRALTQEVPHAQITGVDLRPPQSPIPGVEYSSELVPTELIFHLAGKGDIASSVEDPQTDLEINARLTLQVLESLRAGIGSRVVLASSCSVYGAADSPVRENQEPRPISPYGVSKLAAEHYVRVYHHLHGIDGRIARIGNPYGPGQRRLVIYDLARQALRQGAPLQLRGDGTEVRDFVHAMDVARGLIAVGLHGEPGETYNVSAGQPTSVFDVAKLIAVAAGLPQESVQISNQPETGKVREFYPSIEKLKSLGFHLMQPIEQGIVETVNWARNNP